MATNSLDFLLNLRANTTGFDQGIHGAKFAVNALVGAMAALGVGLGVKELAEAADSYANLSARIQLSTKDTGNFTTAMAGVHQIALTTNSSLDSTAELFTKLNTVAKDMGMTQQQALDLTKTVTQAIKLGGGSVQGSEAAVQQFIQAMQGGVLRGEEFNSMMENGYGLAEALAKGLGVTTGELRKMAENGELGAERVLKALESQKAAIEASYAELPNTIGNALQKIATSWQIVIGGMDQATGASATVASWLSMLADNLSIIEVLLNDIGDGFVWFGDQLKKIDVATIEALKTALLSAYDAIKSVGLSIGTTFETSVEVLNAALGQVFNFSSGIDSAKDKTNGFTKALQYLNVAFGFLSDGFKAINIGMHLIIGGAYDAAAAFSYWKSKITFGEVSAQAQRDFEKLSLEAQKHYKISADEADKFESAGLKAIHQISLTQDEKNAESVANNLKTLNELTAQEQKHVTDYKAISDERIKLQQQLLEARKAGDQGAIDAALKGLAELDKKEKDYQAESKKISDEKIKLAQEWVDSQLKASDGTIKAADAATQKILQTAIAAQGLAIEFDNAGKATVKAMDESGTAVQSLDSRLAAGRKGVAALGLDFDVLLNKVSEGFTGKIKNLDDFTNSLELMGVKGKQASDAVYAAWIKLLETAKSPAEIDAAKAKLKEYEEQGVFSTRQVESGMLAVQLQTAKAAETTDEATQAFKRLGIQTKENLALQAKQALSDFDVVRNSGQATQADLQKAYQKTIDLAYASGNAALISTANSKAASLGLQVQVDETGKASVKSMDDLSKSVARVGDTARNSAAQGFRDLGRVAREEAQNTADSWEAAMAKISDERTQRWNGLTEASNAAGADISSMANDFYKNLIATGMSEGMAKSYTDRASRMMWEQLSRGLAGGTVQGQYDATTGRNESLEWMNKILEGQKRKQNGKDGVAVGGGSKSPSIQSPTIQAPSVESPKMPSSSDFTNPKTQTYRIVFDGKEIEFQGDPSQQDLVNDFFTQMEQAKKRM